jgi:hypothetical protein
MNLNAAIFYVATVIAAVVLVTFIARRVYRRWGLVRAVVTFVVLLPIVFAVLAIAVGIVTMVVAVFLFDSF